MAQHTAQKYIVGTFVDSPQLGVIRVLEDHVIGIDAEGIITSVSPTAMQTIPLGSDVYTIPKHEFVVPGTN